MVQQLSAASRVLNNKNAMPILDCFLMEVAEGGQCVIITASDTENTVRLMCPLVAFEPDEDTARTRFCLRSRLIIDSLKEIPSQPVTLTINMETMEVRGDYMNGNFAIVGERADEYPAPPTLPSDATVLTMSAPLLLQNINACVFALADDEIHPVMTGIFFDIEPDRLTCVGTDGRKMVRRRSVPSGLPAGEDTLTLPSSPASFILPKKTSFILRTLLAKADGMTSLRFNDKQLLVEHPQFTLMARLIDGRYPNYNSVIPQNNPYTATVERDLCIPALRRVLAMADRNSTLVKLTMNADHITLTAQDVDFATSATEDIPATWDGPADFRIGVKGNIFYEVLQNLPAYITLTAAAPSRALLFMPTQQEPGLDVLMLLMPMMIAD